LFGIIVIRKKENGNVVLAVIKLNLLILIFSLKIKPQKTVYIVCANVVEIRKNERTKIFILYKKILIKRERRKLLWQRNLKDNSQMKKANVRVRDVIENLHKYNFILTKMVVNVKFVNYV